MASRISRQSLPKSSLGFRHKQHLVEETEERNTTVEPNSQPCVCHGHLHSVEVVCDSERPQVQQCRADSHTLRSGPQRKRLGGHNPCQTGVRPEKAHVQNKTSEIDTFSSSQVCFNVNRVSNTNQHQPNEEPNKVVPHTRRPNLSMYKIAGMVPISNDPPPTKDINTEFFVENPILPINVDK